MTILKLLVEKQKKLYNKSWHLLNCTIEWQDKVESSDFITICWDNLTVKIDWDKNKKGFNLSVKWDAQVLLDDNVFNLTKK